MGAALRGGAAVAARVRGAGPGPLLGAGGALPATVRRAQHDGRRAEHPGQLLPLAALADAVGAPPAARRVHAEVDAPVEGGDLARRGSDRRGVHAGARRPRATGPRARPARRAVHREVVLRPGRGAPQARDRGHRDRPGRATLPAARRGDRGGAGVVPRRGRPGVGPGGGGQHGRLVVHRAAPAGAPVRGRRPAHAAARVAAGERLPRRRFVAGARDRAGGVDRGDVRRLTCTSPTAASRTSTTGAGARASRWGGWPSGCATSSTSTPSSRPRSTGSRPGWPVSTTRPDARVPGIRARAAGHGKPGTGGAGRGRRAGSRSRSAAAYAGPRPRPVAPARRAAAAYAGSWITRSTAARTAAGDSRRAESATPAPSRAARWPFSCWSPPPGTMTSGIPRVRALQTIP